MTTAQPQQSKRAYTLRAQVLVFAVGLVVLASLCFGVAHLAINRIVVEQQAETLTDSGSKTLSALGQGLLLDETTRAPDFANKMPADILYQLVTPDLSLVAASDAPITRPTALKEAYLQALSTGESVKMAFDDCYLAVNLVKSNGAIIGLSATQLPYSALGFHPLATVMWGVALSALICLIAIPIAVVLVRHITRPLHDIAAFAESVSASRPTSRLSVSGAEEFAHLAVTLNAMMQRVEHAMRQVQKLAFFDQITELPNRERFKRVLQASLQTRREDCYTAVVILNVDRFRWVNETLGPQKGDEALSLIGRRIRKSLESADQTIRITDAKLMPSCVARLGGDEFAIMIPNISTKDDVTRIVQMVIGSMRQPLEIAGQTLTLGLSGGVALAPVHGFKGEELLKNADLALKEARRSGRGRARFYSSKLNKMAQDRMHLEADLRKGIECHEFVPYFQPKIDFSTGVVSGAEALVRWQRSDGDLISPGIFIPMSEQLGLISKIGDQVLWQSCEQAVRWMRSGFDCKVAVNVSPLQFEEVDFSEKVLNALRETGLPPGRLELEITETMAVGDTERVSEIMRPLRAMGVRLAIDDFGAGHSNLVTLTRLPFDVFKIDQQFVSALHSDKQAPAIVEMILAMAETMGLETVAEGVETPAQSDFLRRRGCTLAQGYLYSKPVPADDFMSFLQDWKPFGSVVDEGLLAQLTGESKAG